MTWNVVAFTNLTGSTAALLSDLNCVECQFLLAIGTITGAHNINVSATSGVSLDVEFATTVPQIVVTGNSTVTLNALLTITALTLQANITFSGTSGFTATNLNCITAGKTNSFVSTNTYTVNGALTIAGTAASSIIFNSTSGGSKAIITLGNASTNDVGFCSATDIDSSLGLTIFDYKGTLSNTSNWKLLTNPKTIAVLTVNN